MRLLHVGVGREKEGQLHRAADGLAAHLLDAGHGGELRFEGPGEAGENRRRRSARQRGHHLFAGKGDLGIDALGHARRGPEPAGRGRRRDEEQRAAVAERQRGGAHFPASCAGTAVSEEGLSAAAGLTGVPSGSA